MTTRVGVGRSRDRDSVQAGKSAARDAIEPLGDARPTLVIVFATAGYDQQALLDGVAALTGREPIVGCSAEGIITRDGSDETSHAVAVLAIASDEMVAESFFAPAFAADAAACGRALAEQIRARDAKGHVLVVLADGIAGNCTELVRAIESSMPGAFQIVGGTAGDFFTFERTYQYHRGVVASGGVTAILIGGAVSPEIAVTHGCDLIGTQRVVTRADDALVCEIDGQPAWSFFKQYLAEDADTLEGMHIAHLLLTERLPEAAPGVDNFTVRVPVKLDAASGALYFAAGIKSGTRVQLARRNPEKVCERTMDAVRALAARRPNERPLLVLDFDCAGRGRLLFGGETNERLFDSLVRSFGSDVPWLGLHTYGEIAPVQGRTFFHNYTAVLLALYPGAPT